ncbi:hypothetical protein BC835DRAFT_305912 [Cytidiella melzeri]|nr:hypothetical protein BC835DRAFT_305912 [Cytidiella melzeri]
MSAGSLFDIRKQLTFYGAYHSNPTNIAIHITCVPLILWSAQVLTNDFPVPHAIPHIYHKFNDYLIFDLNFPVLYITAYLVYYAALDPVAALTYVPTAVISLLTARAFVERPNALMEAAIVHAVCWIAQFIGHGVAEKRAPALLDNIVGAVVLAPFFVHLEILFALGYRPALHHDIKNGVGIEIARIKKIEGDKKRAAKAKEL